MKRKQATPDPARLVCGLLVVFTIAYFGYHLIKFHWTAPPKHFNAWYVRGSLIRIGVSPYDPTSLAIALKALPPETVSYSLWAVNPPPYYALFVPFTFLPLPLAGFPWRLLVLIALGSTGYLLMRTLRGGWSWEWAALICLIFLSNKYFLPLLEKGHYQVLFLWMLTAVWWAHHQGRPRLAGVLLGASVVFKPIPLILIPLFLIKRRYKTVVAALATLVGLSIGSVLLVGGSAVGQWLSRVKLFHEHVLFHKYQLSAISLFHKLMGGASPTLAYWLGAGAMVALYAASLVLCARNGEPLRVAEYALVVTLVPLCSPYLFPHHLTLLALPLLVVAHLLMEEARFPGPRWGVFAAIWLTWALGFYYFRWQTEESTGLKSFLGYVPLLSAIGLWGFLLTCMRIHPAQATTDKATPREISPSHRSD